MSDIASLSNSLDSIAKLVRILEKNGVEFDDLMRPVNDRLARSNLVTFLRAGCPKLDAPLSTPIPAAPQEFAVWKTLTIGGVSKDELLAKLGEAGNGVSGYAKDLMSKPAFTTAPEPIELKLARVKVRDLGFKKSPTTRQIWERIRELGHELCPAEVGPHLRFAYEDQPRRNIFWLAMEQITDSDGNSNVFDVKCYGSGCRWLNGHWTGPDNEWNLDNEIVFVVRESS